MSSETPLNPPTEVISNGPMMPASSMPLERTSDPAADPLTYIPGESASHVFSELLSSTLPQPPPPPQNTSLEPAPSNVPRRKQLTRDQRLQIHTLRKAGHSYDFIVNFFKPDSKVTFRQVAYAATQPIEPQNHKCGAKPKLDAETRRQVKDLMENKSAGPRPITYKEVSTQLGLEVSQSTLRRARYEDDAVVNTRPYQYDKKKVIRPPRHKKAQPKAERVAKTFTPSAAGTTALNDQNPAATVPADLAASWTDSLQNFMCDDGPQQPA